MNIRPMTDVEKRSAAKAFVETWLGRGDEKQDAQNFWRQLLQTVYGVESPESDVLFEYPIKKDVKSSTIFIDAYIKDTAVLIEQKGKDINLRKHYEQSDGSKLTPYGQARRYAGLLPHNMNPRWIVVSNFQEFHIHDMNNPNGEPYVVLLKDLEKEYTRLNFLVDTGSENLRREMEISKKAGDLVGLLYDALLKKYGDKPTQADLHSLNVLCVRLVFCLYAEDAGIFGKHLLFHDYLKQFQPRQVGKALEELFAILDQTENERPRFLSESDPILSSFPYVNGGLFKGKIDVPPFDDALYDLLLSEASAGFDWSEISPTIFGAMFESTLNPETRRKGGMHYTSIENIHKVIDPLFLDDLKAEYTSIMSSNVVASRHRALEAFQDKLASLEFLDPAAGSGNFLTESYLCIRRLENQVIRGLLDSRTASTITGRLKISPGQIALGTDDVLNPIKVSITQFHGIEINDFAVSVARTALWIAESQMLKETENIIHMKLDFLPLKTQASIVEGNALRLDWESVVDKSRLNYIMGNPPFVGFTYMNSEQKKDVDSIFPGIKNVDYVSCWFKKAGMYTENTGIECAFVATNSITQGETASRMWETIPVTINFAYRTFQWDNEANEKAHVHCVIIGFAHYSRNRKVLFDGGIERNCTNINVYLLDAPNVVVSSRNKPICSIPPMIYGNKPADGSYLILTPGQHDELLAEEPQARKWIYTLLGGNELINNKKRYCLWLEGISPSELRSMPKVKEHVLGCKETRLKSPAAAIRKFAETPHLFAQRTQPNIPALDENGSPMMDGIGIGMNLLVPRVSSERRRYVPMGYVSRAIVTNDQVQIIPDASLYHFGVLESNVHMAWMRTVCGRLKSDYRYSKDIVYNNFPWPTPTDVQRAKIEQTAQAILDARTLYPDASLADLYDELTMPPELRKAHQANDCAVMEAYGIKKGDPAYSSESACVAFLMKRYQELTAK